LLRKIVAKSMDWVVSPRTSLKTQMLGKNLKL